MSTLTPIAAVVVEVQTEEELAIPVSETAEIKDWQLISGLRPLYSIPRKQPCRGPGRGALLFLRIEPTYPSPENKSTQVGSPGRYYGPPWEKI